MLAPLHLARRPGGDVLAARLVLEHPADRLAVSERAEAYLALWELERQPAALDAAWGELCRLRSGAPAADRESMLTRVDAHRRVVAAREGRGA